MNVEEFKEDLSNQLRDQLRGVEMNITNSFLNGKICSPLLMEASNMSSAFLNRATQTIGLLNQAGLYINEDGIEVDPHMVTDAIEKFISTSMGLVTGEMLKLKDHVTTEILRVPDTSIIMQEAKSVMWQKIESMNLGDMLEFDVYFDYDEQIEQRKTKTIDDAISKFSYFCSEKVPKVTKTITYWENRIASEMNNISCYIAFGPDWVIEKATYYAQFGFDFVESYIDTALNEVNQFKEDVFRGAGRVVGGLMATAFDKLVIENMKALRNEKGKLEGQLKIEKYAKLQKGMIKIMNKLGVKVDVPPSEIINKDMINKVKNEAKIAEVIKQFTSSTFSADGSEIDGDTLEISGNVEGRASTGVVVATQKSKKPKSQEEKIIGKIEMYYYVWEDGKINKNKKGTAQQYRELSHGVVLNFASILNIVNNTVSSNINIDEINEDADKIEKLFEKANNFYRFFILWCSMAKEYLSDKKSRSKWSVENIAKSELAEITKTIGLKELTSPDDLDTIELDAELLFDSWCRTEANDVYENIKSKYSSSSSGNGSTTVM